ncbi:MAG TPA: polysaccharide deacetylase family protein [Spirillospora sp.]|nr:polysaccharide deacetylase family protein [Spirillospora sp.]
MIHNNFRPIPIFTYHSISYSAGYKFLPFIVRPDDFAAQMAYLHDLGYTPMTVSNLVAAMQQQDDALSQNVVAITFDDGYADFYYEALPVLQHYGIPATLYVTTAYVGSRSKWLAPLKEGSRPMMTWSMIRKAHEAGIEIGAHSHSHPELDILPNEQALEEICKPKPLLEAQIGAPVKSFAYPYGYHSAATIELVKTAGYTSACTVNHAFSFSGDNVFALSRIPVLVDTHLADFRKWLRGEGLPVAPQRELLRSKMWRSYRRLRMNSI